jgi:hypothetical protein
LDSMLSPACKQTPWRVHAQKYETFSLEYPNNLSIFSVARFFSETLSKAILGGCFGRTE